ncbi:hypothetical protein GCM10009107_24220 [Ideonella azotifigens]|uniref:Uncharacterized protein n=1 Tax=Ideonella azotifigens TaxID=513160 RepID=A0ABP3V839_9BURK
MEIKANHAAQVGKPPASPGGNRNGNIVGHWAPTVCSGVLVGDIRVSETLLALRIDRASTT